MLKSFMHYSGLSLRTVLHDDGTISRKSAEIIKRQFPNILIIPKKEADLEMEKELKSFPWCWHYRRQIPMLIKFFDFVYYSKSSLIVCLDTDVLFFKKPGVMISLIKGDLPKKNMFNKDLFSSYVPTMEELRSDHGIEAPPLVNCGMGIAVKESYSFEYVERLLERPKAQQQIMKKYAFRGRLEEALQAIVWHRFGFEYLPKQYDLLIGKGIAEERICKHYVGAIRTLFYKEGTCTLKKNGFLSAMQ